MVWGPRTEGWWHPEGTKRVSGSDKEFFNSGQGGPGGEDSYLTALNEEARVTCVANTY